MSFHFGRNAIVIGLLLVFDPVAHAQESYIFKNIVDTTTFKILQSVCSINDAGVVAFGGTNMSGSRGIFTGSGGPITTIADFSGQFRDFSFFAGLPINNSGQVAFRASLASGDGGVFVSDGVSATTIALAGSTEFEWLEDRPLAINSSGSVAFFGIPQTGGIGIYVGNGGSVTTIAHSDGPLNFVASRSLSMNDSGVVAFSARHDSGEDGIFVGDGTVVSIVADSSGPYFGFGSPSINSDGVIAFVASPHLTGGGGIFTWTDGIIQTIADDRGPYHSIDDVSLDDHGAIAFSAELDGSTRSGIYTGPDPVIHKVIQPGDSLFGSTATFTNTFTTNARGDVVFRYILANGVSGIAVASVVPEPPSVALLVMCLVLIFRRRYPTSPADIGTHRSGRGEMEAIAVSVRETVDKELSVAGTLV